MNAPTFAAASITWFGFRLQTSHPVLIHQVNGLKTNPSGCFSSKIRSRPMHGAHDIRVLTSQQCPNQSTSEYPGRSGYKNSVISLHISSINPASFLGGSHGKSGAHAQLITLGFFQIGLNHFLDQFRKRYLGGPTKFLLCP